MTIQTLLGTVAVTLLLATTVQAGNLDLAMSEVFPREHATYIGYESIEREDIPVTSSVDRKYLIVDFRLASGRQSTEQLQASVHQACMALLKNRELIHDLSESGYDMVAVAFDRRSQFDCL
ncbi:hypothetical protein HLV39_15115 [Marinobacter adhaerens]|uniref:Uncharacterized protein n=1 Tax=Marinobacter adhaerens TaxID=1033846 RepID=A0A851I400_9GAMM|nr:MULTISPECIES: hypothetical protein [Marinobacter]NWN92821.1 hypothetical protein [Marinobacter adhaerens]